MSADKKQLRASFRQAVFERDKYKCRGCGFPASPETAERDLDAHHITDRRELPNGGYVLENGITLCKIRCHELAEVYHISEGRSFEPGYHPSELYLKIHSSSDKAKKADSALSVDSAE
jgi:hypothetical protein